ncbi:ATP-dependent DNA helicase RecG [Gudongella oleilytica]|uniref:ATP-dependent DNA helicase RecG n=1 Tax=Gudongella oleilytica TaxID=1582259 RepID=UPI002A3636CA|nr:ATP-dependent DNA helicase RecG [Gudongella oleilytica]MDY0256970.1 ATP-dependent DNA helicase RecG [Gudongella oleilytica]
MNKFDTQIQYLKGVGPKKASIFRKMGIMTLGDLLFHLPRAYEDRTKTIKIQEGVIGEKQSFVLEVTGSPTVSRPRRGLSILQVPVRDSTGEAVMVWFNQDYLKKTFSPGQVYIVYGKLSFNRYQVQIQNPDFKLWSPDHVGSVTPIYPLTDGISNNEMKKIVAQALSEINDDIKSVVPKTYSIKRKLPSKLDSLIGIHFPKNLNHAEISRRALAYEELLLLQIGLLWFKNKGGAELEGIKFKNVRGLEKFIIDLPYKLTAAQIRVIQEIISDMTSNKRMNRLVQGDVGSGKTVVSAAAMVLAVLNGYQATMMAPTEILADQHFETLKDLLKNMPIKIGLLKGSMSLKSRESILNQISNGEVDIVIGTHALIQDSVKFKRLGLAITDEQHRFGVRQRIDLSDKGDLPDMLIMTATPIPRTLALILYGDLDISIIDELPPGRKLIETYAVGSDMEDRIFSFIRKQIIEGRQAYVVCPLIEEQEKQDLLSAEKTYERLTSDIFPDFNIGLIHGRMGQAEKEASMRSFKTGEMDILVSTTVIEVGVNVPNANIMLILNAERFGLAQLHQLRGRIGRGKYKSYCILINDSSNSTARERMRILQSTSDGFKISEKDLELRGPGEFFGTKQHGLPQLKAANLLKDMDVLKTAQEDAIQIISQDPELLSEENALIKAYIQDIFRKLQEEIILN